MRGCDRTWLCLAVALLGACDSGGNHADAGVDATTDAQVDASDAEADCVPPVAFDMEIGVDMTNTISGQYEQHSTVGVTSNAHFAAEVVSCDPDCTSNCVFRGPIATPSTLSFRRCSDDVGSICTSDAECGGSKCIFFASAPIGFSFFTVPVCGLPTFAPGTDEVPWPIEGNVDLATGAMQFDVFRMDVRAVPGDCTSCDNDPVPLDGKTDGETDGNCADEDNAFVCDVGGYYEPFDAPGTMFPSSLDCLVPGLEYDDAASFTVDYSGISTEDASFELTNDSPDCAAGGGKCFCGVCAGDHATTCLDDTACDGTGPCSNESTLVRYDSCVHDDAGDSECDVDSGTCPSIYNAESLVSCGLSSGSVGDTIPLVGSSTISDGVIHANLVRGGCIHPTGGYFDAATGAPGPDRLNVAIDLRVTESE